MSKFAAKLKADGYAGGGAVAPDDGSILTPGFRSVLSALKQRFSPAIDAQMPGALSNDEYEARFHDNINSGKYVPQMGRSAAKAAQPFVNVPAQLARGWVAGTAGLPGDLESLARTVNNLMTPEGSRSQRMDEHSTLPTSEFYRDWLPGKDDSPLGSLAGSVGNLAGGVGAQRAAQGVQKAATLSRGALGALADAAASSTGRMGRAGQLGAVRVRGGNFNDFSLDNYLNDTLGIDGMPMGAADHPVGQWARTQLRNYLRKDMGSPNDPLLQVEKELPNMHLQEDLPGEHDSAMRAQRVNRVIDAINDNQRGTYLDPRSGYTKHARAHMALTNEPITPWGALSDEQLTALSPDGYAERLLREKYGYSNRQYSKDLAEDADKWLAPQGSKYFPELSDAEHNRAVYDYAHDFAQGNPHTLDMITEFSEGHKNLRDSFNATRNKVVPPWLDKASPDTKIWNIDGSDDNLGFGHVLDYLSAAVKPHQEVSQFVGRGQAPGASVEELLRDIQQNGQHSMIPFPGPDMRRWKGLMDAGLLLDPRSLGRLSVADAVRKTAAWNEHLASQGAAGNPDLARGIARVHKEYFPGPVLYRGEGSPTSPSLGAQPFDGKFLSSKREVAEKYGDVTPYDAKDLKLLNLDQPSADRDAFSQFVGYPINSNSDFAASLDEIYGRGTKFQQLKNWLDQRGYNGVQGNSEEAAHFITGTSRLRQAQPDMRWVELGVPEPLLPDGWKVQPQGSTGLHEILDDSGRQRSVGATPEEALRLLNRSEREEDLSAGLNAEGQAMGHCVGGYCDDVASRGTKIYSLRDKNNNPHVTVETRPGSRVSLDKWGARKALSELDELQPGSDYTGQYFRAAGHPDVVGIESQLRAAGLLDLVKNHLGYDKPLAAEIAQIKGKQNAAPVDKYLPYVQDFVKSGNWGRVGDLGNTGLVQFRGGKTTYRPGQPQSGMFDMSRVGPTILDMPSGYMTPAEAADHLIKQGAPEGWARNHVGDFSNLDSIANRENYARGGSVIKQPRVTSRFAAALTAKG